MRNLHAVIFEPDDAVASQIEAALSSAFSSTVERVSSRAQLERAFTEADIHPDLIVIDLSAPRDVGLLLASWVRGEAPDAVRRAPILGLADAMKIQGSRLVSELGPSVTVTRKTFTAEFFLRDVRAAIDATGQAAAGYAAKADVDDRRFMRSIVAAVANGTANADADRMVAARLNASNPSKALWTFLGELRLDGGDAAGADSCAMGALQIDPHHVPAMNLRARVAVRLRRHEDAIRWMEAASELSPLNTSRLVAAGQTHRAGGRLDLAEDKFRRALSIDGECVGALVGLASILTGRGRAGEARGLIDGLSAPGLPASQLNMRGVLLSRQGLQAEAIEFYGRAIGCLPSGPDKEHLVRYNLALALARAGDPAAAARELSRCVEIRPDFAKALAGLARLRGGIGDWGRLKPGSGEGLGQAGLAFLRGHAPDGAGGGAKQDGAGGYGAYHENRLPRWKRVLARRSP